MHREYHVSQRTQQVLPSSTLAITARAKKLKSEGRDVISLAAGEPDFDTPDFIKDACIAALKDGFTKYTPTSGILELKEAIAAKFSRDNNLEYSPEQIVVSCGAKHSIFNTLFALVDKGDEVLIPSPYWVSYPEMVRLCEGIPVFLATDAENNFKITPEQLKENITAKTKLLILNNPSNPCGSVYSRGELLGIAKVCVEKGVLVISDEIYEKLIYDNLQHISLAGLNKEIYNLTITVNGFSKSFSMTGWRLGYLAAPLEIARVIAKIQDHTTSNATSFAQKAAVKALQAKDDFIERMRYEFQQRRDYALSELAKIEKIKYILPQGAFYIFCDIHKTGLGSFDFSSRLLEEALVAVIPGQAFGRDDFIRISFATGSGQLRQALERIATWLKKV